MNNTKSNRRHGNVSVPHVLAVLVLTYSLVFSGLSGRSYQASAAFKPGVGNNLTETEREAAQKAKEDTQDSTSPSPTPASASPSPTASAQPESTSQPESTVTENSSTVSPSKSTFDWTPLVLGGGVVALLVIAGGITWYMKRSQKRF